MTVTHAQYRVSSLRTQIGQAQLIAIREVLPNKVDRCVCWGEGGEQRGGTDEPHQVQGSHFKQESSWDAIADHRFWAEWCVESKAE